MSEDEREKALLKHRKKLKEKRLKVQSKLKEKEEKQKKRSSIAMQNPSFQYDDPKGDYYIDPKDRIKLEDTQFNKPKSSSGCMLLILIIVAISLFIYVMFIE